MSKKAIKKLQVPVLLKEIRLSGHRYFYNTAVENVKTADGEYPDLDLRHVSWQFTVADSRLGIIAVAMALGNGMADLNPNDDCVAAYDGLGVSFDESGRQAKYKKPFIFLSPNTAGYRSIWGGPAEAFVENLEIDSYFDICWSVDVYGFRPNLGDGGILIQSSSSAAFVAAVKEGNIWTLTLTMPMLADGRTVGSAYAKNFRAAWAWYQRQVRK